MRSILRWLAPIPSFLFGVGVLWTGQVGPNDAVANWQKWLRLLGIESMPAWMKSDVFYGVVMTLAAALVIGGIGGFALALWRRRDLALPTEPIIPHDEFIPMREAATRAYETFRRGGGLGKLAPDELSRTDPLSWCASFLLVKGIPVYGVHSPARDRERIPDEDLKSLHIEQQGDELHDTFSIRGPRWTNLEVRIDDLDLILSDITRDYSERER